VKLSAILLSVATVVVVAAQQSGGGTPPQPADMHNSRNSLDWAGTYEGVLACTDCPGTKTRLTLNRDDSYRLVTQAQGSQSAEKSVTGVFTWQPSGNVITLDERGGRHQFSVGEGRLTLLGPESGASPSPAANRVLTLAAPHSRDLEQQLGRYRWTLVLATDANNRRIAGLPPGQDHPVVLSFDGSRLSVQGPCNRFVGGYQVTGANQLTVNVGASTRMACDPALMQADSAVFNLLAKPLQVQMTGFQGASAQLQLVSPGNGTLNFTGEPTPESLYGPSTTVFLEIAAQSVPCANPPSPNTRCLQYRERHYDDKGLVVGTPGEWKPLTVNIEGFTHREGVRNVLRVKQFQGPASAGGVPANLYVLDLVVESEIVKPH
jgi:heat shock protein HslJ